MVARENMLVELNEIVSEIDSDEKLSSTLGSISGAAGLGTAAALLGPVGLITGGLGAIAASFFLSRKLKKEKAINKIKVSANNMKDEELEIFIHRLKQIPREKITPDLIDNILVNLKNGS